MAVEEYVEILRRGVGAWNNWRKKNPELFQPDLSGAYLEAKHLVAANLEGANLSGAYLVEADLSGANLEEADLSGANLREANLHYANLIGAVLIRANLSGANLSGALLIRADLSGADLRGAQLIGTDFSDATLTGSSVYGVSVWDIKVSDCTKQQNLIITDFNEPVITVDNIKVAQFIHLLLNNKEIRDAIDTITSKVVLILGRFSEERKRVLDAIREELRKHDYLPIMFDFDKPASKDLTGTVDTLARMARFIIADLTDPSSIPHELSRVMPLLTTTPLLPIMLEGSAGYGMFKDLRSYPWVLKTHKYKDSKSLISELPEVIAPAERKVITLRRKLLAQKSARKA